MKRPFSIALLLLVFVSRAASAQDETDAARADFAAGVKAAAEGHWGEALVAFDRSYATKPHALTMYNIATCERALGNYTRAREKYDLAKKRHLETNELPSSYADDLEAKRGEIERSLAHLSVTLDPPDAAIAVDGRPVTKGDGDGKEMVAGVGAPGAAAVLPAPKFELALDPGPHVFTVEHKGFQTAIVRRDLPASSHGTLDLGITRLPAVIHIAASRPDAVVRLDGQDVGVVPLALSRPAGRHDVDVRSLGFVPYHTTLSVMPGEEPRLDVKLTPEKPAFYTRWWFWTGVGALVVGAVVTSTAVYFATRGREPPDGGSLGWVAPAGN